jgi:hypothetical protein
MRESGAIRTIEPNSHLSAEIPGQCLPTAAQAAHRGRQAGNWPGELPCAFGLEDPGRLSIKEIGTCLNGIRVLSDIERSQVRAIEPDLQRGGVPPKVRAWASALIYGISTPVINELGMLPEQRGHGSVEPSMISQGRAGSFKLLAY